MSRATLWELLVVAIAHVGRAFPPHYYSQDELIAALEAHWAVRHHNLERLAQIHKNTLVGGRYLALPLEAYPTLTSFTESNDAYIRCAVDLGGEAIDKALSPLGLCPADVDHLFFVSVTGVATPSVDARLFNRLSFRSDCKRTPIFGLGCVAGAAGLSRACDYLRAYPRQVAVLLSVELCSLTLQPEDLSIPNIIASGLFGDGAAAVVLVGSEHPLAVRARPCVLATRSVFYPHTEHVMGWEVTERGFKIVLSADVPAVAREHIGGDVDAFLQAEGLSRAEIASYVCHPGGPRVLDALAEALAIDPARLAVTWRSLREAGNLSSASVLLVLGDTMQSAAPRAASKGLLLAMGPGFCAELVLLQW